MARAVQIDFRKWPDRPHWNFTMFPLADDGHGTWLWRPPGITARRGLETPITTGHLAVQLVTPGRWWTATWADQSPATLYVDIATPATWAGDRVTMVDLDLDVVRRGPGPVEVHDRDEFDEHRREFGYPPHIVAAAEAVTARIAAAVAAGEEPFRSAGEAQLERARETWTASRA